MAFRDGIFEIIKTPFTHNPLLLMALPAELSYCTGIINMSLKLPVDRGLL